MRPTKMMLGSIVLATLTTTASMAATEVDADGDGMLSYPELTAFFPTLSEESYLALDANADGMVDTDELSAAQEAGMLPATDG